LENWGYHSINLWGFFRIGGILEDYYGLEVIIPYWLKNFPQILKAYLFSQKNWGAYL